MPSPYQPGQWRLSRIELVNWGTFDHFHELKVARKGFLLTGASGSGKSSIVDAITAVLTPRVKSRFNAAAADGSATVDRTVLTYVRGAWSRAAGDDGEVATQYLRPGATWSGIALTYGDGRGKTATLAKLYHVKNGASTPADVKEQAIIASGPISLPKLAPFAANGLDMRGLKREQPQWDVFSEHAKFQAKYQRVLGIPSERAVHLLHKTQSAKNLGSLDDLFRSFMLDDPTTFATADRALEQFTDLSTAHKSVVDARRQIEALTPLVALTSEYDDATVTGMRVIDQRAALDAFAHAWKLDLTDKALADAEVARAASELTAKAAEAQADQARDRAVAAQVAVATAGGAQLGALEERLAAATQREREVRRFRDALAPDLAAAEIDMPTTADEFALVAARAAAEAASGQADLERFRAELDSLFEQRAGQHHEKREFEQEITSLRNAKSNIDRRQAAARALISEATGLPAAALPFAAELLQVRSEYRDWTGAIERVLRPLATVMLVPAAHELVVSAAADAAHLGTRLRFDVVPSAFSPARPAAADSLVYRVEVADHPMRGWLGAELARRFDYACVETARELVDLPKAVTRAGQVKRGHQQYEKDDRRAVTDRGSWILGFDNADKLEHFAGLLRAATEALAATDQKITKLRAAEDQRKARLAAAGRLAATDWDMVDTAKAEADARRLREDRATLLAADGDLRAAQALSERANAEADATRAAHQSAATALAGAQATVNHLTDLLAKLRATPTTPVDDDLAEALRERYREIKSARRVTHDSIDEDTRRVSQELTRIADEAMETRQRTGLAIGSLLSAFNADWTALTADLRPEVAEREGYLAKLAELQADRLPEFEKRFLEMLRDQSQQNVGLLAAEIRGAPGEIRRRVDPINVSLRKSPFAPGRYLQIRVVEARPQAAADLLRDLASVSAGSLGMADTPEAAEAKFATLAAIMRQLGSSETADRNWRQLCLDTRRHVKFIAHEVSADGAVLDVYDSGAGRSGGQKQKLVVFCLAAALRYQLTSGSSDVPSYGTVVMDEAFDKADAAFTRMALDIFREFGFHMVLATPLKLLQTLEHYVGGIALITCKDSRASSIAPVPFLRDDIEHSPSDKGSSLDDDEPSSSNNANIQEALF